MARKILLADDSVTAQNMGRKILTDAGYEVIAVNNGSAALKKIAELKPELAILDVYMPGYSGLEVCQRLKESPDAVHIPVLLSVGKLEPFKPEEAQRVRAEGYIVKPFEASELLSALAKLEDKIVPRAEASKQGRFARAIAAVEEANKAAEAPVAADGWQSRIGMPKKKDDAEERVADDASIYNAVNRDLRTVVETPAEKLAAQEERRQEEAKVAEFTVTEASVDVAAVAPEGLPKDVTPQEIAAIAAAAAQIRMAAAIEEEPRSEVVSSETIISDVVALETHERIPESETPKRVSEEETDSEPATMAGAVDPSAAAVPGESRWTAVSVALDSEEASVSLEQEMQKAYASFSAAPPEAGQAPEWRPDLSDDRTTPAEAGRDQILTKVEAALPEPALTESIIANAETTVTPITSSEPHSHIEPIVTGEAAENSSDRTGTDSSTADFSISAGVATPAPFPIATDFAALRASDVAEAISLPNIQSDAEITATIMAGGAPQEAVSAVDDVSEPRHEPVGGAELVEAVGEAPAAEDGYFAIHASAASEDQPAPLVNEVMIESATPEPAIKSSVAFAPIVRDAEPNLEPELDPESVKSTAAAWASWREIRDAGQSSEAAPAPSQQIGTPAVDSEVHPKAQEQFAAADPAPLPDTNAMAVAAGAEQISQEASSAPSNGSSADVASIVDSLLADLRPKLMEEIARKMAQKK